MAVLAVTWGMLAAPCGVSAAPCGMSATLRLDVVNEVKLLGTIITNDLKWNKNTKKVQNANAKMKMLHIAAKFVKNKDDLLQIYKKFIRSRLEYSCVLWHSSLSKNNESDIERVQKAAIKVILKDKYSSYEGALKVLGLESLKFYKEMSKDRKFEKAFPSEKIKT